MLSEMDRMLTTMNASDGLTVKAGTMGSSQHMVHHCNYVSRFFHARSQTVRSCISFYSLCESCMILFDVTTLFISTYKSST